MDSNPPTIRLPGSCDDRNAYVFFRHSFLIESPLLSAELHLFANTRYRLKINGRLLGHGPGRFKLSAPEYDSYDLTAFLTQGENVIAIEVNTMSQGTFLSDPGGPGLITWGEVHTEGTRHSLATGAHWRVLQSPEHDPLMPELSFAVGPGECRDARAAPVGWELPGYDAADWLTPEIVAEPDWGPLLARSIPMLDERDIPVAECVAAYGIAPESDMDAFGARIPGPRRNGGWAAAATFVHSKESATITLGWAAGELHINGNAVKPQNAPEAPYRGTAQIVLRAGWNKLVAFHPYRADLWELGLLYPRDADFVFRRAPDEAAEAGWLLAGPQAGDASAARSLFDGDDESLELPPLPGGWMALPENCEGVSPMVERGWSALQLLADFPLDKVFDQPLDPNGRGEGGALTMLFDFGGEVLGRPRIELSAPAGTVVDLAYTERVIAGQPQPWFQGTRMLERFIIGDGRSLIHAMHPRGMRYLEVTLRNTNDAVRLHSVGVTAALYPVEQTGEFACSDPLLNRIWEIGRETQAVCMEDAYLDCPWRERGLYTGDLLVQYATNLACFGDHDLLPHSLELIFRSQGEDGLLAPCSHGLPAGELIDYTAWAIRILREYWERTGDLEFVRAMRPYAIRALDGLLALSETSSPLIDATGHSVYLDRSIVNKDGVNCALNCVILGTLRDAAYLLKRTGEADAASTRDAQAEALAEAIREAFMDQDSGLFLDRRREDDPDAAPSAVGNILALLENIAHGSERAKPLRFVLDKMESNFEVDPPKSTKEYHISPYFSHYLLRLLEREGREDEAVTYIRKYWGFLLEDGAWTFREFFAPIASLCHAWSTAPVSHFMRSVLGVWPGVGGDPDQVRFAPHPPPSLDWAQGILPHPKGLIKVAWRRDEAGGILPSCEAPPGVTIVPEEEF